MKPDLDYEEPGMMEILKGLQKQITKQRREKVRKAMLRLVARCNTSNGNRKHLDRKVNDFKSQVKAMEVKITDEDEDPDDILSTQMWEEQQDDPEVKVEDLQKTTKEMLLASNVIRRPSV
jgi:hypothetical protein